MNGFTVCGLFFPIIHLMYPKVDSSTKKEVKEIIAKKLKRLEDDPNEQVLIDLLSWMAIN